MSDIENDLAIECLDAIRLVLASPAYDAKKIEVIELIMEHEAPQPDISGTTSVAIFLRQIDNEVDEA